MNTATRPHRIRCAHCVAGHSTASAARECHDVQEELAAQAHAEYLAEQRAERYFEEGPESFQAARYAEDLMERERLGPDAIWV